MEINGFELVETSGACPESYDVKLNREIVGYLRLRHGHFRAEYPECGGRIVYTACPRGDGIFEHDERMFYLTKAVEQIKIAMEEDKRGRYTSEKKRRIRVDQGDQDESGRDYIFGIELKMGEDIKFMPTAKYSNPIDELTGDIIDAIKDKLNLKYKISDINIWKVG
jgi:hypothetical protein